MDKIKIVSLNCQGIGCPKKRRDVFNYIRSKNPSIVCLQDTHFTSSIENLIESEWGYTTIFSSYQSNKRGVAILFKNNFEFIIHNSHRDQYGNMILLDISITDQRLTFVNIYGPNDDCPDFYDRLKESIFKQGNDGIIIVGDWNLLLDPPTDGLNYKHINNPNARNAVLNLMTDLKLFDVWREENGDKHMYTWKRKLGGNKIQMGRLDFFLVSETLLNFCSDENILPSYRSDHLPVTLSLSFHKIPKRKTYWKFNNSLLSNKVFLTEIKDVISHIKKQYAATPYNQNNIDLIENSVFETIINPQVFFDILLLEIRSKTISFATHLKKNENTFLTKLENEIKLLENDTTVENYEQLKLKQQELQSIRENKLKGVLMRSKAKWIDEGEKPSSYFCHLENRHFVSKSMKNLVLKNGEETMDFDKISSEVMNFYKDLFTSRENDLDNVNLDEILNEETPKLSDIQALNLEGKICFKEAGEILFKMKNGKSPGSTGFTSEFFKCFWKDLGHFLINSINYGFQKNEMSVTQREGIITCIPKGNKPKKYIKNWRPISLLNISYKIASGCIANRIKSVLPLLIGREQSGFMSERFTGDNIRQVYDILSLSLEQKRPGIMLLIDFEKAFDSVAWSFIEKTLTFFNFKNDMINWVRTFQTNIKSTVIVNGNPSLWFPIERGCRQGDPVSSYIFLLCSEIMAHMIRQNKNIKGYTLFDIEYKIAQFADDTSLFLDGSKSSFEYCVQTILEYAKFSGLAMNFDKTKVVWFGCKDPPSISYLDHLNFEWNPKSFSLLGVEFTTDLKDITDKNIMKKLTQMTIELNQWSKRDLTPFGRITVIKTLILSKIVHILISLPSPTPKVIKDLNTIFYKFLWNNKPDRIKRTITNLHHLKGGLNMIDLNKFDQSLKLTWIRRFFNTSSKWKQLTESQFPKLTQIINYSDKFTENLGSTTSNKFWKDVFTYLSTFVKRYKFSSKNEAKNSSFLYNSRIKVGKTEIKDHELKEKKIFFIHQLMDGDNFLKFNEFRCKYNIRMNMLRFFSIISSIKNYIKTLPTENIINSTEFPLPFNVIFNAKKGAALIYRNLNSQEKEQEPTGFLKWNKQITISKTDWKQTFRNLKRTTKDCKLIWLQYRISHSILTTNRSVSKFNHQQSHLCQFCNLHSETIHHLFWQCPKVTAFWTSLSVLMNKRCMHAYKFRFTEKYILFGMSENIKTDKICDFITLMAKFYIYKSKVQHTELNVNCFIINLYYRYEIEKYTNKNSVFFRNIWGPYLKLFKALQPLDNV